MRKDNRKVLSPSGLTRGSTSNQLALLFNLDSRVKPENDNTFVKGFHGWKRSGGAAVVTMSFCLAVGLGASEALAQCAVPPTCESLGYDLTSSDCEGKRALKCPFDASKVFCSQTIYDDIAVGNIYYSDGTISDSVIAGKTPIGIVAYLKDKGGLVISLEEKKLQWSENYNNLSCLPDLDSAGASGDMNGASNTQCIMSQTNDTYPAAAYCNGYAAVSTGKGSKGWYLPAAGELRSLSYSYGAINLGLSKLSKTQLSSNYYWSSSEYYASSNGAWRVMPSDGTMGYASKYSNYGSVRCVLAF